MLFINRLILTTNRKEKDQYEINYPVLNKGWGLPKEVKSVPIPVKPQPDYYWILKEKWFWCNEQDWIAYMERVKQEKRK